MLFTSYGFIAFVAVLLVLYYVVPKKTQWMLLLAGSYFFYAFSGLGNFAFIISVTVSTYVIARIIAKMKAREDIAVEQNRDVWSKDERKQYRARKKKSRLWVLILGVALNLGILAVIKYTGFAVDNVSSIITLFGGKPLKEINLPMILGISYFIFQSVGYLIDVYRGKTFAEKNIARFALFVSFFPQLVQGPISRHSDLASQLYEPHKFDSVKLKFGLQRILWGLFKKIVIADRIYVAVSNIVKDSSSGAYVFLLIIFYSIQIYADFTGGIDIAIGIAEALGMKLAENFDHPFSSRSTKEYWNRWHMTMGSWFNDYIFLPLSVTKPLLKLSKSVRSKNNRFMKGLGKRIPVYTATIVTWLATGIWHGAAWNFVVWGLLNCLVILVSQELEPLYRLFRNKFPKLVSSYPYHCFEAIRTFLLMGLIRTLDCYGDVGVTFAKLGSMFTTFNWGKIFAFGDKGVFLGLKIEDYIIVAVGVLIVFIISKLGQRKDLRQALIGKTFLSWILAFGVLMAILLFGAFGVDFATLPSIYGQF